MIEHCTAIILAGGESKRMGQDKASLIFERQTLLARAEQRLTPLFKHIMISVREQRHDTDLPQVLDNSESRAPMMGIVAALETVKTDWIFVVGVDMPFVSPDLVRFMAKQRKGYDAVLAGVGGKLQPLLAFYHKDSSLPVMHARIKKNKRSLMHLIPHIRAHILTGQDLQPFDPELQSFIDFDTKDDLRNEVHLVNNHYNCK